MRVADTDHSLKAGERGVGARPPGDRGHRRPDLRGDRPARSHQAGARGADAGQPVGRLILPGNPTNFFAESEQVAFHTGHLVPGIDATDDPLLAARNFSYLDTQLTRLGGPNFDLIPINRPHVPVNDNHRDGFMQQAVHARVAPYRPNSLDGGCPFIAGTDLGEDGRAYLEAAVTVAASRRRGRCRRRTPTTSARHAFSGAA